MTIAVPRKISPLPRKPKPPKFPVPTLEIKLSAKELADRLNRRK